MGVASARYIAAVAGFLFLTRGVSAQDISFVIPSQPLSEALLSFSRQSDIVVTAPFRLLEGKQAPAVEGRMPPAQALKQLLAGTGLKVVENRDGAIVIQIDEAATRRGAKPQQKARGPENAQPSPTTTFAGERAPVGRVSQITVPMDEIIVMARKRQESFLGVPVVATVLTQQQLERFGTYDLFTLKSRVTGLLMGTSVNAVGTQVSLRGVGPTSINQTEDQSISLNIDGLQISHGIAYSAGMFDVAQVEVLKGPQALFFGKNSPAGVISLRTVDPTERTEVIARAGYEFDAKERIGEFIVSGPVSPALKLRLAVRYAAMDGYFRNDAVATPGLGGLTPTNRNLAPDRNWILRGTALLTPNETYSARLKLNYTHRATDGASSYLKITHCPDGTGGVPPGNIAFLAGDDCKISKHFRLPWLDAAAFPGGVPNGGIQFVRTSQTFGTLEQNLGLNENLALTSVTGMYQNAYNTLMQGSTTGTTVPFAQQVTFHNRNLTQELRLTSSFTESPVNFMVGGYYQDGRMTNKVRIMGNVRVGLPGVIQFMRHDIGIRSTSVFGQLIWNILPKLEIAPGARWTHEKRVHTETNYNPNNGPVGNVPLLDPVIKSTNVSPEVSLTYRATEDLTVFGSYKQGFKSGSFNGLNYVSPTTRSSFGDEKVQGGEVGIKSRLFDRTLALNAAGYYYHYTGIQVGALELGEQPGPNGSINRVFITRTVNAASANVIGIEVDATYEPVEVPGLALHAAVNWNRSRYGSFTNAPCGNGQTISQGCNQLFNPVLGRFGAQDLSGRELVRAPDWSANFGFSYEKSFANGMTLTFANNVNYTGRYSTTLVDRPGFYQSAYAKVDANIALKGANNAWELALIGNNITDKLTMGFCANSNVQNGTILGGQISGAAVGGPAGDDEAACMIERGREVWLRLTLRPLAFLGN